MEALTEALRQYRDLHELRQHWTAGSGPVYLFRYEGSQWIAARVSDGTELTAGTAEELRVAVADDYAELAVRNAKCS